MPSMLRTAVLEKPRFGVFFGSWTPRAVSLFLNKPFLEKPHFGVFLRPASFSVQVVAFWRGWRHAPKRH